MSLRHIAAIASRLYHLLVFSSRKQRMQLEKGMLIISIDVDVGNRSVGIKNKGNTDANVHNYLSEYAVGKIEETALPLLVQLFEELDIPSTFAVRGQLTEVDSYFLDVLRKSSVQHDIGAHGYYHRNFTSLSELEAESARAPPSLW